MKIHAKNKFITSDWYIIFKECFEEYTKNKTCINPDPNFIKNEYASRMGANLAAWNYYYVYVRLI